MRLLILLSLISLFIIPSVIPPISFADVDSEISCNQTNLADDLVINFETRLDEILKEGQKTEEKHKSLLSQITEKMIIKKLWTENDKNDFYLKTISSTEYQQLETKKQAALEEYDSSLKNFSELQNNNQSGRLPLCECAKKCIKSLKTSMSMTNSQWLLMETRTLEEAMRIMKNNKKKKIDHD